MSCKTFIKDVSDKRKMTIDFSGWLDGASIFSTSWTVATGITQSNSSFTSSSAVNYFSGGTDGQEYEVACAITTDDVVPRIKTERFLIAVENRC